MWGTLLASVGRFTMKHPKEIEDHFGEIDIFQYHYSTRPLIYIIN